jgi:hypothetical protein
MADTRGATVCSPFPPARSAMAGWEGPVGRLAKAAGMQGQPDGKKGAPQDALFKSMHARCA